MCRREGTNIYDQDTYHGILYHCSQHLLPRFQEDYISLPLVVWFEELPYGMSIVLCPIFHLVMQFLGLMKYEQNCHMPWVNRSFKNHCAFPVALLVLRIRWPKYWSFSFNISPSNEHSGLISFRMDWLDLLAVHVSQWLLRISCLQDHWAVSALMLVWSLLLCLTYFTFSPQIIVIQISTQWN